MPDSDEDFERRLAAIERAIDDEPPQDRLANTTDTEAFEARLAALESRVDELDAAVQAVRGFLGGVSAVNEAVERRADAAVAAVEQLETRLDGEEPISTDETHAGPGSDEGLDDCEIEATDADSTDTGLRERLRGLR